VEYKVGDRVIMAGRGINEIVELPNPPEKTTITLLSPSGQVWWAGVEDIVRFPEKEYYDQFIADSERLDLWGVPALYRWRDETYPET